MGIPQELSGWGRYPRLECTAFRPERVRELESALGAEELPHVICRGLGRSYGDAAVNAGGGVIDMSRMNRMLRFQEDTAELTCEAGVNLREIADTFVPRGFFLPVTPGTKFVTVGGAIANDVHGKNHHKAGTFSNFLTSILLLLPSGERIACSRSENEDVFWATIGGVGLTGIIIEATISLKAIPSAYVRVDYEQAKDLHDALQRFEERDDAYEYSVAWVDCVAKGAKLGRAVLMRGNHASPDEAPAKMADPYRVPKRMDKTVPFDFPAFALNKTSIGAFNEIFYRRHEDSAGKLVDYDRYFYPLDSIRDWNRMYGKRGFTQYQVTLPKDATETLVAVLERVSNSSWPSFLGVLKSFGPAGLGFLSHPIEGHTLTMDIPVRPGLEDFLHGLDEMVVARGGRLYLAKDAFMREDTFAAMYPKLDKFRAIQGRVDPEGRLSSSLSRRLNIVERPENDGSL